MAYYLLYVDDRSTDYVVDSRCLYPTERELPIMRQRELRTMSKAFIGGAVCQEFESEAPKVG